MWKYMAVLLPIAFLTAAATYFWNRDSSSAVNEISVAAAMANSDTTGFARANRPRDLVFPEDHGPHPGFKTEWWYLTGNLQDQDGHRFGYQFTLFRNSLSPQLNQSKSSWSTNQMYMGHFAVSDIDGNSYYCFERFSRAGNELAGARAVPLRVWLEDWQLSGSYLSADSSLPDLKIAASADPVTLDLQLMASKPLVLQGNRGLSQKGAGIGNASYYYSMTRLASSGKITIGDQIFSVSGDSWMDREWSTSALSENQVGWDWFSLQLSDSTEIMYYQLRRRNGQADIYSKGLIVYANETSRVIKSAEVMLRVTDYWNSPRGGRYPAEWHLSIPKLQVDLQISPLLADQEMTATVRYWEGSVIISGQREKRSVTGKGYVELTGYAE